MPVHRSHQWLWENGIDPEINSLTHIVTHIKIGKGIVVNLIIDILFHGIAPSNDLAPNN